MAASALPAMSLPQRKRGYQRLAAMMAWDPGVAMVPRFRAANIYTLLCLQAEIQDIEEQLELQIQKDDSSDGDGQLYSCDFDMLKKHGKDSVQWKLILELRQKLDEYNRMAIQQFAINNHPSPCEYDYRLLHNWMDSPCGGLRDLRGAGAVAFLKPEHGGCVAEDFLALSSDSSRSDWFRRAYSMAIPYLLKLFPLQHRPLFPEEGTRSYKIYGTAESLSQLGDRIATMLATMLILIPVIVLHFVTGATRRLILIVVFTLIFTASMALLANAKRSEIFAAAAAFVAVQVVYVGSVASSNTPTPS